MDLRHAGSIALLALMAVAALFFFPVSHGSYSATHGPMTALRASRFRVVLMFAIASAAAALMAIVAALVELGRGFVDICIVGVDTAALSCSPLRC